MNTGRCIFWVLLAVCALVAPSGRAQIVNFESPQIHPLDMSPDGSKLAACNTADNRVELYDLSSGAPTLLKSIPVGLDPVSVRFASNTRLLAVNHVSDSVSVIDVALGAVIRTIAVPDEPCDVVVAGPASRAFVTCSQVNKVVVINYNTGAVTSTIKVLGEDPRALAVSPDKTKVYAAVFESGNKSTLLGGGALDLSVLAFPPNVVSNGSGPHGGQNPPPNDGDFFYPPKNPGNGAAPRVGLIVKQSDGGDWLDDTGTNWTNYISGAQSALSGRPLGWNMPDHDLVVIDANTLAVSYVNSIMNANMALAVNPASGQVSVVGTEAINELRFEPNVNGVFVRVIMATASDSVLLALKDLNEDHLAAAQLAENGEANAYLDPRVPQSERNKSIGDPRGIAWNAAGTKAYITGMGSNNLIVVNTSGGRTGLAPTIPLREGPTGIVVDDTRSQLYALNRFHGSLSVVNLSSETETANLPFYDPTPLAIRNGRKHLYDTHKTSGLGQVSCASCHLDARFDRLAWDLGDPAGMPKLADDVSDGGDLNLGFNYPTLTDGFDDFHPMKGPMTTQTLVGIIGHEPFHWRGDRLGIEEFNPAFEGLLGDDALLTPQEMQQFEDFLATLHFMPNPYRNLDNTLPTSLPLEGHYATGDNNLAEGTPLPNGNAVNGLRLYRGAPGGGGTPTRVLDQDAFTCMTCHTLPSGDGTPARFNGSNWTMIPPNSILGANHVALVSVDGSTNRSIKVPHLAPIYDKVGFLSLNRNGDKSSLAGFGFAHDGSVDTVERFFAQGGPTDGAFRFNNDQEIADMVALMLAFSGSDFVETTPLLPAFNPPGNDSADVHAAVGQQTTFTTLGPNDFSRLEDLMDVDEGSDRIELIATGVWRGSPRGYVHVGGGNFSPDQNEAANISQDALLIWETDFPLTESLTFTIVPDGMAERSALDRDGDGYYNYTELLDGSNPADPNSFGPQPEGEGEGVVEGIVEGGTEGVVEGLIEGVVEGVVEGGGEGTPEGIAEGIPEGGEEGIAEGTPEGSPEGTLEGSPEGSPEGTTEGVAEGEGEGREAGQFNSADLNQNGSISLTELLRPIQLYNTTGFRCITDGESSEDGYMPGFGNCRACADYSADYQAPFCRLSLSELLRLIQHFNLGSYHACDAPDFFCPGPAK